MKKLNIPRDEIGALCEAHKALGRKAKAEIRHAWITGNYSAFPSSVNTSALQRFRNSGHGGPSALNALNLSRLADTPC